MDPSPAVELTEELSFGGEPPEARARRAGGRYLACICWVSANLDMRERGGHEEARWDDGR